MSPLEDIHLKTGDDLSRSKPLCLAQPLTFFEHLFEHFPSTFPDGTIDFEFFDDHVNFHCSSRSIDGRIQIELIIMMVPDQLSNGIERFSGKGKFINKVRDSSRSSSNSQDSLRKVDFQGQNDQSGKAKNIN